MQIFNKSTKLSNLIKSYFPLQDLHTIDMEDFKYGKTNITGFRLVDENNADLHGLVVELNTKWAGAIRKLDFPIKTIRVRSCFLHCFALKGGYLYAF